MNKGDMMRAILFLIGAALSAAGLFCGWTGSMGLGEAIVVAMGVVFILWSALYDACREKAFLRFLKGIFVFVMIIFTVYSVAINIIGRMDNSTGREDYVIVLGAGLNGSDPSAVLKSRLDTAVDYLATNPSAEVIVSGSKGENEAISEAVAMSNYLIENGIGDGRILIEDSASSTYENFALTKDAVAEGTTVFITNDFHVLRASLMAQLNGVNATHIGAPTPVVQIPVVCARELVAQIAAVRYYIFR